MRIKPWLVVVVVEMQNIPSPVEARFFDTHIDAIKWVEENPRLTCVVCSAVAVFGPMSGVGIDSSVELIKSVV